MSDPDAKPSRHRAAVIDVGSNSVRLVLYHIEGRAIWTVFNEKVLAGLGRDLTRSGTLSPAGVETALTALRRFAALLSASRPDSLIAVATAAVRDADDGFSFRQRVRRETELELRILSGPEEARFAALGVLSGAPDSEGIVADLGGASLELTRLASGAPGEGVSLPLGPFSMASGARGDVAGHRRTIDAHLAPLAAAYRAHSLNLVGGAWRNLALLHMKMTAYPLGVVHQYRMSRRDSLDVARFIARQSRTSLERIEGVSKRRVETLPHAALLLESLVEILDLGEVVISAYGVREGLLYETMDAATRSRDPLVEGCAALTARMDFSDELGKALTAWLSPAFARLDPLFGGRDSALVSAACELADLGARLHPDHRADLVFDQVLRAPIAGMDHAERAFLACACFARHTAAQTIRDGELVSRLLNQDRLLRARALGAAIRLGCDLSGRTPELLAHAQLDFKPEAVVLRSEEAWAPILLGEQTTKRASTLAGWLDRGLRIRSVAAKAPRTLTATSA